MIPAFTPVDNVLLAYNELLETNDIDEKTHRLVIHSLSSIASSTANMQHLTAFINRVAPLIEDKPHLMVLLNTVKRAIQPLLLYSSSKESASYYDMLTFGNISGLPSRMVALYRDLFIDGGGPWKKIFDLVFSSLHHIPALHLEHTETKEETHELETKTLALIRLINASEPSVLRYPRFIDLIREIANLPAAQTLPDHPCVRYVRKICFSHYVDLKIFPFCEQLITTMLDEGRKQLGQYTIDIDPFQLPLEDQFRYIHAAPQNLKAPLAYLYLNRLCGAVNVFFDSHRSNNIPWQLLSFKMMHKEEEKIVKVLRMGTPTYQRMSLYEMTSWSGKANIDPEFQLFIDGLAALNQSILFISLQDDCERSIGTENTRNEAQKLLTLQHPNHFFYSIFAHDSPFYHQTGEFELKSNADDFKANFLDQLLGTHTGYFFHENWLSDLSFKGQLQSLLSELHHVLFEEKKDLNHKERCQFIQIYYIFLALKLLTKTGADKLVFCCKDSIDRAGIENALLHYILLVFFDQEMSHEQLKAMMVYIHAATIIVKQQEMNRRHERLLWALEILQDPRVRMRIKARKRSYKIAGNGIQLAK